MVTGEKILHYRHVTKNTFFFNFFLSDSSNINQLQSHKSKLTKELKLLNHTNKTCREVIKHVLSRCPNKTIN